MPGAPYAALAHPAMIEHYQRIGITAVELMPVHQFVHDNTLLDKGLRNYWGYNTIGFFAPHNGYSATGQLGQQVQEFKGMVRSLHDAGIEVILDVVYNHTAEGNHLGPTLSFKGIDNDAYYRLVDDDRQYYMDYTGTGNSLNVRHPHSLQLIMDSLRYWVLEMHVDGFRFDLASALAREFYDVDKLSTFFELVQQDPTISQVKLIAEPWDIGPGGYQVGNFPPQWTEWNGKYRDTVRDFWRGESATLGEFASRLTGSADLYEHDGRRPVASINFVTAHDGFTLADLVSYNEKHNDANGESNNDGESHNRSWNGGVEGPTDDPAIQTLRARQQRNFLATLLLSQGVPMVLHGDELGRTQHGNNNTYAQDSELSWVHWDAADTPLTEFVSAIARLRSQHPTFRRARFFDGRPVRRGEGEALPDIVWLTPAGDEMVPDDWGSGFGRAIGVFLNGQGIRERDARGEQITDLSFILYFNAHDESVDFTVPSEEYSAQWETVVDTAGAGADSAPVKAGEIDLGDRQVARGPPGLHGAGRGTRPLRRRVAGVPGRSEHTDPRRDPVEGRLMRIPKSTYRLQIREEFDLTAAAAVADYIHQLGADWMYFSPILKAERGSEHGYDVIDHSIVDPTRGGAEGLDAAAKAARELGLGLLVDIVPNHVGVATPMESVWWRDLLTHGRASRYAEAFDVDWEFGGGKIRIPVLGDENEPELSVADGELRYQRPPLPARARLGRRRRLARRGARPTALRADQLAPRRRRVELPPVLRGQHAGRHPGRAPVGVRRVARRDRALDPGRHRRRPAGRSPGRFGRPRRVPRRTRGRDGRYVRPRREDPRRRRAAPDVVGRGGDHRLRRARRHRPGARRSERPAGAQRARHAARDGATAVSWAQLIHDTKREIADGILRAEVLRLERDVARIGATARRRRTVGDLAGRRRHRRAARLLPGLPLVPPARARAPRTTRRARPRPTGRNCRSTIDALVAVLADADHPASIRFQQTSGMVMAKGVEDTAFYRYSRLGSLTEVGADPAEFSIDVDEFHRRQQLRQATLPTSLTTLSTHDTKRGEDVRARISVLAEVPLEWERTLTGLREAVPIDDGPLEHLLWEAIIGAWPASRERLHAYAEKAAREAGTSTSWSEPAEDFERRMHDLVDSAFDDPHVGELIEGLLATIAVPGWIELAVGQADPADRTRCSRRVPGQRAVGAVARRSRQPASGRLRAASPPARRPRPWHPSRHRRHRSGEAARDVAGLATSTRPSRAVHALRAPARLWIGRPARRRVRPW